jgi:hypothetical protein
LIDDSGGISRGFFRVTSVVDYGRHSPPSLLPADEKGPGDTKTDLPALQGAAVRNAK